jgi:hypothetical protein
MNQKTCKLIRKYVKTTEPEFDKVKRKLMAKDLRKEYNKTPRSEKAAIKERMLRNI